MAREGFCVDIPPQSCMVPNTSIHLGREVMRVCRIFKIIFYKQISDSLYDRKRGLHNPGVSANPTVLIMQNSQCKVRNHKHIPNNLKNNVYFHLHLH